MVGAMVILGANATLVEEKQAGGTAGDAARSAPADQSSVMYSAASKIPDSPCGWKNIPVPS